LALGSHSVGCGAVIGAYAGWGDPLEGMTPEGLIRTGASRERVPAAFEPVLAHAVSAIDEAVPDAAIYLYGSVATGQARVGVSDVDLLTVDLPAATAAVLATALSTQFASICRGVEIAPAQRSDIDLPTDEAYGLRVFMHHYCVHLAGPPYRNHTPGYPADRAAARGFNGDIARHAAEWRHAIEHGTDPAVVGRRVARKTLLAVAGLVSVHDHTWTTNRSDAARRWAEIDPARANALTALVSWLGDTRPTASEVGAMLHDTVNAIVARFADDVGLWA